MQHFKQEAARLSTSGRAVLAAFGGTGFGDIALVPGPSLRHSEEIRDITEWYISILTRQDYIHAIFSRQCELALDKLARVDAIVGDGIEVLYVCGIDFGTQRSSSCSPETFDSLRAPYYRRINDCIHAHKARYGDRLVFWGGGVDTQGTLPFGTPEAVRREVLERCEIFSKGGGFVFTSVHCARVASSPFTEKALEADRRMTYAITCVLWSRGEAT